MTTIETAVGASKSMVLNMGPQHPSTHGVLRLICELEGESREAICRDLKITPENLFVRLFRARLLLRRCLEMNWFCGEEVRSRSPEALTCPAAGTGP